MKKFLLLLVFSITFIVQGFAEDAEPIFHPGDVVCSSKECYTIINQLGEGAFGTVFSVENSQGEPFALKTYKNHEDYIFSSSLFANVQREFQRGQSLNHTNIIKSYDLFVHHLTPDQPINNLVLQLVEGKTLSETRRKSLAGEEAIHAAFQFSSALQYALTLGFMHLDLHEGNIMLSDEGELMIIDLASFFTFDELFSYVATTENLEEPQQKEQTVKISATHARLADKPEAAPILQAEKIRQFFLRKPELFAQLKRARQPNTMVHKFAAPIPGSDGSAESNANNPNYAGLLCYYFDNITEICIKILKKSNLNREDKINLQAEIKKLSWNYLEDFDEGKEVFFDDYMDKLLKIFQSYQ